jgi:hypothetical protein
MATATTTPSATPHRYPKADADAAIRAHAQAASHPAAEALTVTGR